MMMFLVVICVRVLMPGVYCEPFLSLFALPRPLGGQRHPKVAKRRPKRRPRAQKRESKPWSRSLLPLVPLWLHILSIWGPFWVHLGSIRVEVGSFWVHFGSIVDPFGVNLCSFFVLSFVLSFLHSSCVSVLVLLSFRLRPGTRWAGGVPRSENNTIEKLN